MGIQISHNVRQWAHKLKGSILTSSHKSRGYRKGENSTSSQGQPGSEDLEAVLSEQMYKVKSNINSHFSINSQKTESMTP